LDTIRKNGLERSSFFPLREPVQELGRSGDDARADTKALHEYIQRVARQATASRTGEDKALNPEWVAEIVYPTAEALVFRELLENHADQRRAKAYQELTGLFRGKVKDL
jgi:hypothetical protein